MKTLLALPLALAFTVAAPAQNGPGHLTMDRGFSAGGTVVLEMNVGDVQILPGKGTQLRLEIKNGNGADPAAMASWVRRFDVAGDRATLEIQVPRDHQHCSDCSQGIDVTIYVPAHSDLKIKLGVGNLAIQGVRGNKEADIDVGGLKIGYTPGEYGYIQTHAGIGDIHDPLNQGGSSGFLGKDEDFTLAGPDHLRASVGVGNVDLYEEGHS